MLTFDVREIYPMPYVGPSTYMVGVDLHDELPTLGNLVGTQVKLLYKDRATVTKIIQVAPPNPDHIPPYRKGERIGVMVEIEG